MTTPTKHTKSERIEVRQAKGSTVRGLRGQGFSSSGSLCSGLPISRVTGGGNPEPPSMSCSQSPCSRLRHSRFNHGFLTLRTTRPRICCTRSLRRQWGSRLPSAYSPLRSVATRTNITGDSSMEWRCSHPSFSRLRCRSTEMQTASSSASCF